MTFLIKTFDELSTRELYNIIRLRNEVFVVEQQCPYQDADGKDFAAIHLAILNEAQEVLAYCRVLPAGITYKEHCIGRVVNAGSVRGKGLGKQLMQKAIEIAQQRFQAPAIRISAQQYLEQFYTSLGFAKVSEPYLEDNIPHIEMLWQAASTDI